MGNNPRLVTALASALGCALLIIAFLMGRMTGKTVESPRTVLSEPAEAVGKNATTVREPAESASGPFAASPFVESMATPGTAPLPLPGLDHPSLAPPITAPPWAGAAVSPEAQQITGYFDQVERIGEMGGGDPQAFATSLMQSVSSGDFSGFDHLAAQARGQQERLRAITPPPACREHHRLALALASDSVSMLDRLKAAIVKGDSTALLTISTEGKTLEAQANQLKAMGESIKRQAGL